MLVRVRPPIVESVWKSLGYQMKYGPLRSQQQIYYAAPDNLLVSIPTGWFQDQGF